METSWNHTCIIQQVYLLNCSVTFWGLNVYKNPIKCAGMSAMQQTWLNFLLISVNPVRESVQKHSLHSSVLRKKTFILTVLVLQCDTCFFMIIFMNIEPERCNWWLLNCTESHKITEANRKHSSRQLKTE